MKIFAVGMNYARHNKTPNETLLGKEMPVIFTKADSALLKDGKPFFIPDDLGTIEYEAELAHLPAGKDHPRTLRPPLL